MNSNWAKAARSTTKYQLVLMLTLVGSSVTPSPAQAGLDEKSEVLAEWLVDVTICSPIGSHHGSSAGNRANQCSGGRTGYCPC